MDNSNYKSENLQGKTESSKSKIKESANDLLNESKKLASDMYQQGKDTVGESVNEAEQYLRECSEKLVSKIQTNPLSSVLVAVGVGIVLSNLLKK